MSLHKSLVSSSALKRHHNVLTRAERVAKLADAGKWKDGESVFGLQKVKVHRVKPGKAKKAEKAAAAAAAEAVAAAEAAKGEAAEGAEKKATGEK